MLEVRVKRKLSGFSLDVSFSLDQEILTILGPSGSGKTMTLQSIAGLIRPDEGYIRFNERVVLDTAKGINVPTRTRKVGFVFQNYALFPHLTVNQNIAYGIRHLETAEIKSRVGGMLEKMNIQKLEERYPRQLSAGQQQRVAIARALAPEPEVLLLDEPFSALDSLVRERLQLQLQALQSFYKGNILFVTHDLQEGYKLSSRIAVFESGRIVQHDTREKVIFSPSNHTVARLVGYKNLMEGTVLEAAGESILIQVAELGGTVRAARHNYPDPERGQRVTIGIRPEYIRLSGQPGENVFLSSLDRTVEGVTGSEYYFHVNTVGMTRHYLMVIIPRSDSSPVQADGPNYLYLPPEHIAVMPG
jgi:molybdate transport system ATP-binding protein